mgnify:CR=1 FL=1
MANATSANVTVIRSWTEGDLTSKRRIGLQVQLCAGTYGGNTNKLVATAFGLTCIEEVSTAYDATLDGVLAAAPSVDGTYIMLFATVDGTAAAADVTPGATPSGLYLTVKGW